jgi:hypothetical protein
MYKLLLAAGAAALVIASPASANPGKGKGHGKGERHGQISHRDLGPAKQRTVFRGHASAGMWGANACPPGLAKKNNGCLPPGIAKQRFGLGDRWTGNYGAWSYNQVPLDWRSQYGLDPMNRYYYRDGYLYGVDPKTRLVEAVVQALIH